MQTRRFPRTMQEAFGPYTNNVIHTKEGYITGRGLVLIPSAVALVGIVIAFIWG